MNERTRPANDSTASLLNAAVETYAAQLRAGRLPDREAFVAAHPEFASELRRRLALVDMVGQHLHAPQPDGLESPRVEPSSCFLDRPFEGPKQIGKFEVLNRLGNGSFGTVYKARDPQLKRLVAIKVPRAGSFPTPEDQERFLREARSAAGLRHPQIVQVYEIAHERGVPFIVSELIDGRNLGEALVTYRPGFAEAAELVAQIADALDYAHVRKIVHRDIKPANILLDEAGKPHVADFGLARREEGETTMTIEGQVLGTPAYMAPEQAAGNHAQVDGRSDVYSLGVVLYELLTGERPFRGQVRMLLEQVIHEEPRPPRSLNDRVPCDLETVCLTALAKSPPRRYATAGRFAADLRRWQRGEPIVARPTGRCERAGRWCRRNPVVTALTCAVVTALLAGSAVSWHFARVAGKRAQEALTSAERAKDEEAKAVASELVARRHGYTAGLSAARYHLEKGEVQPAARVLAESKPASDSQEDLRGFEWYYRWRQAHAALASHDFQAERGQTVAAFDFSPDGRFLYIRGTPRNTFDPGESVAGFAIWDLENDELSDPTHLAEPLNPPLAISANGHYVAGRHIDGFLRLFDAQSGRELAILDEEVEGEMQPDQVHTLTFSPDGRSLVGGIDSWWKSYVVVWDVPQGTRRGETTVGRQHLQFSADGELLVGWGGGKPLELLSAESVESRGRLNFAAGAAALSPDGKLLAAASGDAETPGEIKLWHVNSLTEAATIRNTHLAGVTAMAFSPDGERLATGSHDATIKIWRMQTGEELAAITTIGAAVDWLVFSPNGELLATSAGSVFQVWDGAIATERSLFDGERFRPICAAFAHDGRTLAVGGVAPRFGKDVGAVRIWDLPTRALRASIEPFDQRVWAVAFSRDDTMLAVGGGNWLMPGRETTGFVKVFDPATGDQRFSLPAEMPLVTSLDFSSDGRTMAVGCGDVTIWNLPTLTSDPPLPGRNNWIYSIDLSDDGTRLAAGCVGGELVLWNVATHESRVSPEKHAACLFDVEFSPDGRYIATAGWDKVAWLWDATTLQQVAGYAGHKGELFSICFSPDGAQVVTAGRDSTVRFWEAKTGVELHKLDLPPDENWPESRFAALSSDGDLLATTYGRNMVRLWDTATRQPIAALCEGHTGGIGAIAFAPPDGAEFATAGWDGTIQIWDSVTGRRLAGLPAHDPSDERGALWNPPRLAFSPDGATLVSVGPDKSLKLWDVAERRQAAVFDAGDGQVNSAVFVSDELLVIAMSSPAQAQPNVPTLQVARRAAPLAGREVIQLWNSLALIASRDGSLVAASGPSGVMIWDAKTWSPTGKLALDEDTSFTNQHFEIVADFSLDGRTLATVGRSSVALWEVSTGTKRGEFAARGGAVRSAAFTPDGRTVATAGYDKTVRLWNVETGQQLVALEGHTQWIQALAFSPRGELFVSGGIQEPNYTIDNTLPAEFKLWRAATAADVADDERQMAERKQSIERRWQESRQRQEAASAQQDEKRRTRPRRRIDVAQSSRTAMLLTDEAVQEQLAFGEEQRRSLDELTARTNDAVNVQDRRDASVNRRACDEYERQVRAVLTAAQRERLHQIELRQLAAAGFAQAVERVEIRRELALDSLQRAKLQLIVDEVQREQNKREQSSSNHAWRNWEAFSDAAEQRMLALLTPPQRERWKTLSEGPAAIFQMPRGKGRDRIATDTLVGRLLTQEAVLDDLKLTDEQTTALAELNERTDELERQGRANKAEHQRHVTDYENELDRILTPDQRRRLVQIDEQSRPLSQLLFELDKAGALTLGDARRAALDELTKETSSFTPPWPDPFYEPFWDDSSNTRLRVEDERCWKLLSADERRMLDERLGPPFKSQENARPHYSIAHYSKTAELLRHRPILQELRVSRQQVKDVRALKFQTNISIADPGPLQSASLLAARERFEAELSTLLSAEQVSRLKQLVRQRRAFGPTTFLDTEAVAALGIRDEQKRTIQSVVDQTNQTFSSQTDANGEPPEVARQLSLLAEGRQRAIEELDEAQRQHWQEWIGQPFDWSRLGE
jgi:WD40 repeat protein